MNGVQHVVPVFQLDKTAFCLIMAGASDDSGWVHALLDSAGGMRSFEEFKRFEEEVLPLCGKDGIGAGFMIIVPPEDEELLPDLGDAISELLREFVDDHIKNRKDMSDSKN